MEVILKLLILIVLFPFFPISKYLLNHHAKGLQLGKILGNFDLKPYRVKSLKVYFTKKKKKSLKI